MHHLRWSIKEPLCCLSPDRTDVYHPAAGSRVTRGAKQRGERLSSKDFWRRYLHFWYEKIYESTYEGGDKVIIHSCHVVREDICHLKALGCTLTSRAYFLFLALHFLFAPASLPRSVLPPVFANFCQLLLIQACPVHQLNFLLMCTCTQADLCDDRGQTVVLKVARGEWRWRGGSTFLKG